MNVKRILDEMPVDPEAEERAWAVVRAAYVRHEPFRPPARRWPLAVAVALAAVVAAAISPPGRAVVDAVRRTIGIEHAAPALFRLPAPGRLLVSGAGGTWVVSADGSKRRLGDYAQASWSPHGLFVVAARPDEVVATEPNGTVHWSLARRRVTFPRWGGTRTDTRVAYLSGGELRVVGGDGKGDAVERASPAPVAPSWRPESHVLAYATRRQRVVVVDTDSKRLLAEHRIVGGARALAWSPDGSRLAVASAHEVDLFGANPAHLVMRLPGVRSLAFARDGRLALLRGRTVLTYGPEGIQTVFSVRGRLSGLAWSPNGRWLVTSLPAADQWIFLGGGRVQAVSHIAQQFGGAVSLDGWVPGA